MPGSATRPQFPGEKSLRGITGFNQACGGLLPSVAQPPLPLQVFWALQPASPVLQPPWPLHAFCPLQECLLASSAISEEELNWVPEWLVVGAACRRAAFPVMSPAMAAPARSALWFSDFIVALVWFICPPARSL